MTCLNPLAEPPDVKRILIIRLGAMGDVVRTLPALAVLRRHYASAHITWLVESGAAGALAGNPAIDQVLLFPREELSAKLRSLRVVALLQRLRALASQLRAGQFELVLDFHSILKSGVLAWLTGAPIRVGYARPDAREFSQLFATDRASLVAERLSRFERNAALVRFLGIATPASGADRARPPRLGAYLHGPTEEVDLAPLRRVLTGLGAPVVLHPGTSESTPYKRYTIAGYAAVARELDKRFGLRSLVTWGPATAERELAQAVVSAAEGAAVLAPESRSLAGLSWLFSRARLFIGSDSGPLHVASLVGTPVVQLLGPTDPVENAPYPGTPFRTVREPVPCSPCRKGCGAATCMRGIQPGAVLSAALELLREGEFSGSAEPSRVQLGPR